MPDTTRQAAIEGPPRKLSRVAREGAGPEPPRQAAQEGPPRRPGRAAGKGRVGWWPGGEAQGRAEPGASGVGPLNTPRARPPPVGEVAPPLAARRYQPLCFP